MGGNVITYETNYSGLGGSQGGGIPSGAIPTPIESIEEIEGFRQQPDFGLQQLVRWPDSDGHQARNEPVPWLGVHVLLRQRHRCRPIPGATTTRRLPSAVLSFRIRQSIFRRTTATGSAAPSGARCFPSSSWVASGISSPTMKACGSPTLNSSLDRTLGVDAGGRNPGRRMRPAYMRPTT